MSDSNATPNLLLLVGLPLILIILTVIVLLVLVFVCYISVKLWRRLRGTGDKSDRGSVKLKRPPAPELAYHMAAPLGDPTEGTRYPYYTAAVPHESRRPGRLMQEQNAGTSSRSPGPFIRLGYETKRRINSSEGEETSKPEIFISMFHTDSDENAPLVIRIDKVVNLPLREDKSKVDSYVRLFFICKVPGLPHRRTWKTKVVRESSDPIFDEEVRYEEMCVEELINSTLHIEVLDYHSHGKHSILGQVDLHLAQVQFTSEEIFAVLTLQPRAHPAHDWERHGTVLLSLNYNPKNKKLSVIILRAKDLKGNAKGLNTQATVWVTLGDHVIGRLKTSRKTGNSPIFNEVLSCHLEPKQSHNVAIKVVLFDNSPLVGKKELGQVTLCAQSSGDEYRHWNEVITAPGKHIAEWHELR